VLDIEDQGPPLLSIYGGKLTTYRRLAEDVLDDLAARLDWPRQHWTEGAILPGGDIAGSDFGAFLGALRKKYQWMSTTLLDRLAAAYGTRANRLLGEAQSPRDLGEQVLPGLHEVEIEYLRSAEWAVTAEDILYRRSKLALHLPVDATARLDDWLARHPRAESAGPVLV